MKLRVAVCLLTVSFGLSSCGAAGNSPALQSGGPRPGSAVAVFSDSPQGLETQIADAKAAGFIPQFVSVVTNSSSHKFTVYARVALDKDKLVVLGYKKVFEFPADAKLFFGASGASMDVSRLPAVTVPLNGLAYDAACSDCLGTANDRPTLLLFAKSLATVSDEWQQSAYTPWARTPAGVVALGNPTGTITTVRNGGPSLSGSGGAPGGGGGNPCGVHTYISRSPGGRIQPMNDPCSGGGAGGGGGGVASNGLPACVKPGTSGQTKYVGTPKGATLTSFDQIVAGDANAQNIAIALANAGVNPTLNLVNTPEPGGGSQSGEPATYNNTSPPTITWNTGLVDAAVDYSSQNAGQIAFHEYDHGYYDKTAGSVSSLSPTMSAVIGGTTYTWTQYTYNSSGGIVPNATGINGYQHAMIDDDLKATYGSDQTGALFLALSQADHPPANPQAAANAVGNARPTFPAASAGQKGRPASAAAGQSCGPNAAAVRHLSEPSGVDLVGGMTNQ